MDKNESQSVTVKFKKGYEYEPIDVEKFTRFNVKFKKLDKNAKCPEYGSANANGADLFALNEYTIDPGKTVKIQTGIALQLDHNFAGFIMARSGMACNRGLAPANKVGLIDTDYRGEIIVALHNHGEQTQVIRSGDKVAQLVIIKLPQANFIDVEELDKTERGDGGFGSTGK